MFSKLKTSVFYTLCFLQTPVFKGKEEDSLGDIKKLVSNIIGSEAFVIAVFAISIAIGLYILYNRTKAIPELEMLLIKEGTWFATREDTRRTGIIVSVELTNKSTSGLHIINSKLSGYSAREHPEAICMDDLKGENKHKLDLPEYKHFCKGQEFYLGPYNTDKIWFYYESRSMTMANVLETSVSVIDSRKKRKSIRIIIPRHSSQIALYQEMAKMW
jgi:hypothetical protein